jgi:hypothetical protein
MACLIREKAAKSRSFLIKKWTIVGFQPWPRNMPYKSTAEPVEMPLETSGGVV